MKKEESKPSNKLWHLKSKNHNSISFPAGMSPSLHEMINSIKKTKFQSNRSSMSNLDKPTNEDSILDSYLKNNTSASKLTSRLEDLSTGNINLSSNSIVIKGFDTRTKSTLHIPSNKFNVPEGVQRLTLRRKIRLDSSINLKDKMN